MKIVFTGGGTAGHAMVNTVLIPYFQAEKWQVTYIGSKNGMEKGMVQEIPHVEYHQISTGKLRRYFSLKNVTDIFLLLKGLCQALFILKREQPQLIYSSGGYVAVPVVWAAYLLRIPIILRETDSTTGLANKLCLPLAKKIYRTFPDEMDTNRSVDYLSKNMIIRPNLYEHSHRSPVTVSLNKPVCLIIGGSSGSANINQLVWRNLNILTEKYSIVHLCGKGNCNVDFPSNKSYQQLEFIEEMSALYQIADVVITRSGSNAVIENLLLGKRMICLPLSSQASRGEQMSNARFAEKYGTAVILKDEEYDIDCLLKKIDEIIVRKINTSLQITHAGLIERINQHVKELCKIKKN